MTTKNKEQPCVSPKYGGNGQCIHQEDIDLLKARVNGDEKEPGIFADVKQVLYWIKRLAIGSFGILVTIIYWAITDHNIVKDLKKYYVAKEDFIEATKNFVPTDDYNKSLDLQSKLNDILLKNNSDMLKKMEEMSRTFNEFQKTKYSFQATRGGSYAPVKKDTFDMEAAKKGIDELLKQ
jgi:hypothetical protein